MLNRYLHGQHIAVLVMAMSYALAALGAEGADVSQKYSLVGVIANGTDAKRHRGVAVVKNQKSGQSATVSVGDMLPHSEWRVKSIARDVVTVSNGASQQELRHMLETHVDLPNKPAPRERRERVEERESEIAEVDTEGVTHKQWQDFYENRENTDTFDRAVRIVRENEERDLADGTMSDDERVESIYSRLKRRYEVSADDKGLSIPDLKEEPNYVSESLIESNETDLHIDEPNATDTDTDDYTPADRMIH